MRKTGAIVAPTPIRSYDYEVCKGYETNTADYPSKYTLPENLIPPVYDQGNVGACVMFSTCSCAESHFRKSDDTERLSPGFPYCRIECRGNYKGEGLFPDYAMKGIVKLGFVPYYLYPIVQEVPEGLDMSASRDDLLEYGKEKKPAGYAALAYAIKDKTWDNIKTALYKDNCAVVLVSDEYFGGGHAILGIGYTDEKVVKGKTVKGQYVEFQNSWGEDWSGDGRDYIPLDYIDGAYVLIWEPIILPFSDVNETDWFFDDVRSVYLAGLVAGTTPTTFSPNANFIRGDVAVIVSRMLEKFQHSMNTFIKTKRQQGYSVRDIAFEKWNGVLPFEDVEETDYYYKAITDVFANGIMTGKSSTEFDPTATMTRAEICTMAVRVIEMILSKLKTAVPANYKLPNEPAESFSDVESSDWYYTYVNKACSIGITKGNGDGTFTPEKDIIRCEGAAIFHRLFKVVEDLMMQAV